MFLAIIKLELVVALPSIIRADTSFSSLKPSEIAKGRKRIQKRKSLLKFTAITALSWAVRSLNSKDEPSVISANGEASLAK